MELDHAYDILMLSYGSTSEEVKRAYHLEAQLVHPDKLIDLPDAVRQHAEERFKQVNEAYQTLNEYISENGAPKKPEWQPSEEWNHRASPASTPESVTDDVPGFEGKRLSPDEALGVFMAREQARGYNRLNFDRTSLFVVAGILYILIRSCSYMSFHRESHPGKKSQPIDTVQTHNQGEGF